MRMLNSLVLFATAALSSCSDQAAAGNKAAKEEVDAKARSEALKREMEAAPKVFSNRDIFKKNEPANAGVKAQPAAERNP